MSSAILHAPLLRLRVAAMVAMRESARQSSADEPSLSDAGTSGEWSPAADSLVERPPATRNIIDSIDCNGAATAIHAD